jgi:colicin import membrane protein
MAAIETTSDKTRATVYAVLVHAACIGLMYVGLLWTHSTVVVTVPGPIIEAVLVGPAQAPAPKAQKPKPTPKPQPPKPEPVKADDPPPEPPKPDTREQEKIDRLALEKAEDDKHEQEEKHRREQVLLDDEKKKQDAADKKKKLEDEKKKQLDDKKAKEQADKQKKADQQHLKDLLEAEEAKTGAEGNDDSLQTQYYTSIQNAVTTAWLRPDNAPAGLHCMIHIIQIPGGEVISVNVTSPCTADPVTRSSIEQAVLRAAPLPYKGFESVFRREFNFDFTYKG